ncbi:NAD(P)/FAD-dependent oxidoreductase [Parathalassolituus penaei]|uniref:FAD-dependent oxidoreductase n=1 Tax=Parathalassolituus penaei TaxID=2997323 RepID=A0A9X3IT60_9GAMM|nr:FAD-dependent oxidoreductase [Parathalassolituus penaei]MCY0966546.1 FAD-dependent oxidoreductase [Parathalassolituus penaei]
MRTSTLVIIGNGMAANRVLEEIGTEHAFDAIEVLSDESIPHYNRIMLSPLLARETTLADITPHDAQWYRQRRIHIHLKHPVEKIDTDGRRVICKSGKEFRYDALLLATGSRSAIPALPGTDASNVLGFRTMTDVDAMLAALPQLRHATVIGAGLLGVEAAVGLRAQGVEVTLMHRNQVLMNRQLDAVASGILEAELQRRGVDVRTGVNPLELPHSNGKASAVRYSRDGNQETLDTDLVIFATGILPNMELAAAAGIDCGRGIQVDSRMRTSVSDVYAIGECCEFNGSTYGLVAPIWDQAKVVGRQLQLFFADRVCVPRGSSLKPIDYQEREHLTKLKVSGVDMHSMGDFNATRDCDVLELQDLDEGIYKKLVVRNNCIIGVLCVGDVADSGWYFELLSDQTDISPIRSQLLFGKAWCNGAA